MMLHPPQELEPPANPARFRSLQKFASVHASVHNHFPTERHLQNRVHYKLTRAAALAEWRGLFAA